MMTACFNTVFVAVLFEVFLRFLAKTNETALGLGK